MFGEQTCAGLKGPLNTDFKFVTIAYIVLYK